MTKKEKYEQLDAAFETLVRFIVLVRTYKPGLTSDEVKTRFYEACSKQGDVTPEEHWTAEVMWPQAWAEALKRENKG